MLVEHREGCLSDYHYQVMYAGMCQGIYTILHISLSRYQSLGSWMKNDKTGHLKRIKHKSPLRLRR